MTELLFQPGIAPYKWAQKDIAREIHGDTVIDEILASMPSLDGQDVSLVHPAETWYGTHPGVSGDFSARILASGEPLKESPDAFGLPFLVKGLFAAMPLSLQTHPNAEQARVGFKLEERLGMSRTDPKRNYRDTNAKPETIIALEGGMVARAGVRTPERITEVLASLGSQDLIHLWQTEKRSPKSFAEKLLSASPEEITRLNSLAVEAANNCTDKTVASDVEWILRTADMYSISDPGITLQLILNLAHIEEGQALHMGAGNIHAYMRGNGIEIMGNSDNVIRAGLTSKHIDHAELSNVASFEPSKPDIVSDLRGQNITQEDAPYKVRALEVGETVSFAAEYIIAMSTKAGLEVQVDGGLEHTLDAGVGFFARDEVVTVHAPEGKGFVVTSRG